jgi:hypothetical protein
MTVPSEVLSGKTELGQKFAGHLLRDEESNFLSRFLGRENEQKALGLTLRSRSRSSWLQEHPATEAEPRTLLSL